MSVITVANLASHPAVWLIFPELRSRLGLTSMANLVVSELWAFGLEAWIYSLFLGSAQARLAVKTTLTANGTSLGVGYGLRQLGWV